MSGALTWYDILGVMPGASTGEIQDAYRAKAAQLGPGHIAGAPSKVVAAADRALKMLDEARRVLCDVSGRARYDEEAGISHPGTGLATPEPVLTRGWVGPYSFGNAEAGLGEVLDVLAPHSRAPRRVPVPDVRGLFASVCFEVVPRAGFALATVRLTEHPMPVDGLVVDQRPKAGERAHRSSTLTAYVWHPPAPRATGR